MNCPHCKKDIPDPDSNDVGIFDLPEIGTIENILEYIQSSKMTVAQAVGVLECAKIELLKNQDILPMVGDNDDEGEEWKKV